MSFRETVENHIVRPALRKQANSSDLDNSTYEIPGRIFAYDPVANKFGFRPDVSGTSTVAPEVLDQMFPMKKKKHEIGASCPRVGDQVNLIVKGRTGTRGAYLESAFSSEGVDPFDFESVGYQMLCPGGF